MIREERIGSPRKNLVFQTSGDIKILVGDKYYTLDYNNNKITSESNDSDNSDEKKDYLITDSISDYENGIYNYPGDNIIIFALNDGIYYTKDNKYYKFDNSSNIIDNNINNKVFDTTVIFNGNPPFIIRNKSLINNLNAQYLGGYPASSFMKVGDSFPEWNELNSLDGNFSYKDGILNITNIVSENIQTDILQANYLNGSLKVGTIANITNIQEDLNSKFRRFPRPVYPFVKKIIKYLPLNYQYDVKFDNISIDTSNVQELFNIIFKLGYVTNIFWTNTSSELNDRVNFYEIVSSLTENDYNTFAESDISFTVYSENELKRCSIYINGEYKTLYELISLEQFDHSSSSNFKSCYIGTIDNINANILSKQITLNIEQSNNDIDLFAINQINGTIVWKDIDTNQVGIGTEYESDWYNNSTVEFSEFKLDNFTFYIGKYINNSPVQYNITSDGIRAYSTIIGNLNEIGENVSGIYSEDAILKNPNIVYKNDNNFTYINLDGKSDSNLFLGNYKDTNRWITISPNAGESSINTEYYQFRSNGIVKINDKEGYLNVNEDGTISLVEKLPEEEQN